MGKKIPVAFCGIISHSNFSSNIPCTVTEVIPVIVFLRMFYLLYFGGKRGWGRIVNVCVVLHCGFILLLQDVILTVGITMYHEQMTIVLSWFKSKSKKKEITTHKIEKRH